MEARTEEGCRFLTEEQVMMLQEICEHVAGQRTRSGRVTIEIRNNMPRTFHEELPVYSEDHVLIGFTTRIYRVPLPEEELKKDRQRNRLPGKR